MKIRVYQLLVTTVLIVSGLVIGLRGTSTQIGAYQTDSLQNATSIMGITSGPLLWHDDFTNKDDWRLTRPSTATSNLQLDGSLNLTVSFSNQTIPQAVVVSQNINLSLDTTPVVNVELSVSPWVHYGIRFSGSSPDGEIFDAWRENSALQHRPGLGIPENLSANLQLEAYLATGHAPPSGSRITQVWFYVEATPGTRGEYSMKITSLQAFSMEKAKSSSYEVSGSFLGVSVQLHLPRTDLSLFQIFVSFEIHGTRDLEYTPFLVNGTTVMAQGFTYVQSRVSAHQDTVLLPQNSEDLPPLLPDLNSTEIILTAAIGQIDYFKLESMSFKYISTALQTQGIVDANDARLVIGYYFLFLFVTPVTAVILLRRVLKTEN